MYESTNKNIYIRHAEVVPEKIVLSLLAIHVYVYQQILAPLILRWDALLFFVLWTETLFFFMKWEISPPPPVL